MALKPLKEESFLQGCFLKSVAFSKTIDRAWPGWKIAEQTVYWKREENRNGFLFFACQVIYESINMLYIYCNGICICWE